MRPRTASPSWTALFKSARSGDTVYVGSGTFELNQPVSGLTIIGNGKTVIENNVADTDGQSPVRFGIYVKGTERCDYLRRELYRRHQSSAL